MPGYVHKTRRDATQSTAAQITAAQQTRRANEAEARAARAETEIARLQEANKALTERINEVKKSRARHRQNLGTRTRQVERLARELHAITRERDQALDRAANLQHQLEVHLRPPTPIGNARLEAASAEIADFNRRHPRAA